MEREQIRAWLDTSDAVRSASDFDLLLFFTRHSQVLLTTEQIAAFVGYDLRVIAVSLEHLVAVGLVLRLRGRAADVDLYVLGGGGSGGTSLTSLLDLASTRDGRLAVIDVLTNAPRAVKGGLVLRGGAPLTQAG